MATNDIITMIGSLGFPIVACIGLWYMINKTLSDVKETIMNNTIAITKLCERLGVDKDE